MEGQIRAAERRVERPKYEVPTIKAMNETEVLQAFQMTAAEISAAGCWWTTSAC